MPLGYILFGCTLIIYSFTFLKGRTCLVLAKGRNSTSVLKHLPPLLHVPSPSPRSSMPQHFCPLCQVPQTSASSTPARGLKNVSGKNLEWLSLSETYSSLFWSHPSRTPLPAQRSLWTAVFTDTNLLCLSLLSFSLHRAVAISQKQLNRARLDLSSVYLCRQQSPQLSSIWPLLQVGKFLIFFPPASPWPPPEPPPQAQLHSFLLFSFKMEI